MISLFANKPCKPRLGLRFRHLGARLTCLGQTYGDSLLPTRHFLSRLPASERTCLTLVHDLLHLLLRGRLGRRLPRSALPARFFAALFFAGPFFVAVFFVAVFFVAVFFVAVLRALVPLLVVVF